MVIAENAGVAARPRDIATSRQETAVAEKTQVLMLDDIDGAPGAKRRTFGWRGATYEIDLTSENADKLAEVFAPYVKAGHVVHENVQTYPRTAALARTKEKRDAIRKWARERGLPVARRGEPAAWLVAQYEEEQAKLAGQTK